MAKQLHITKVMKTERINLNTGDRVMTRCGAGTVRSMIMGGVNHNEVRSYSVALDRRLKESEVPPFPTYNSSMFSASEVRPLRTELANRDILAQIVRGSASARACYRHLMKCRAYNIRPDYKLVRNATGAYDRLPDYDAWVAHLPSFGGMSVGMLLKDCEWFLNS